MNDTDPQNQQPHSNIKQQPQQGLVFHHVQPNEQLVSLIRSKQKQNPTDNHNQQSTKASRQQKQQLISKLKGILHQKVNSIKTVKKSIGNCKRQLKQIGEEVDKQMNKSILKNSKPYATVSIRSIFHHEKGSDPQINKLNTELTKARAQLAKIKSQIHQVQGKLSNPINSMHEQRVNQTKIKVKQVQIQLHTLNEEKEYLEKDIRMLVEEDQEDLDLRDEQMQLNRQKNHEINSLLKQQKQSLYELEREDRILTEKLRYMAEMETLTNNRAKNKVNAQPTRSQETIEKQIKTLVADINKTIEKKNRVENQKKNQLKKLVSEATNIEARNWEIINKLREIDAYLIKHYSSKNQRKTKPRSQRPSAQEIIKQSSTVVVKTKQIDDKNMTFHSDIPPQPIQMIEKRKTYEFGYNQVSDKHCINLTDEMLGNKMKISVLNIVFDEEFMYGIWAKYINSDNNGEHQGYKILPKIRSKQCVTKTLLLNMEKGEVINFIHAGKDENGYIKYLHIITSEGNEFKWGDLEKCIKNEQRNIRKYESILLKGKLSQMKDRQAPNYYCLSGLGLIIIYLGPK